MRSGKDSSRKVWFTVGIAVSLSAATFAKPLSRKMDEPWRGNQDPAAMGELNYRLSDLPVSVVDSAGNGSAIWTKHLPWPGPWWPTFKGSIAVRYKVDSWVAGSDAKVFHYQPRTAAQLAGMTREEIQDNTSAIEKLDILNGYADPDSPNYYKNLKEVREWVGGLIHDGLVQKEADYHGLCHGFSSASLALPEPGPYERAVTYQVNGQPVTLRIVFASSDLKALATYYYGRALSERTNIFQVVSNNCGGSGVYSGSSLGCANMNAGAFHVILSNYVGIRHEGFVVDTAPTSAVWNYPVAGYSTYLTATAQRSANASPLTDHEVDVTTHVYYMGETNPTFGPQGKQAYKNIKTVTYRYRIEVSADGDIVGGNWYRGSEVPDFVWRVRGTKIPFTGDYDALNAMWPKDDRG